MKKRLIKRSCLAALFFSCLIGKTPKAEAQAYDLIYRDTLTAASPASATHTVSFYLYQNCSGNLVNVSNLPVQYSFNNGMPINEVVIAGVAAIGMGNPFCAGQNPVCSATGPLNYQKSGFTYTFTAKANMAQPGLNVLTTKFSLPGGTYSFQAANIAGNFSIESELFNAAIAGIANVAPEFVNPPVIFANVNQPVSYSCAATDANGDSLVYRLRPVSPSATYAAGFTYLNPITANPALALNSRTGLITFKPTAYDAAAGPGATPNKYVIGLDVDEYRKIGGITTKIGTIQRNVLVNVISNTNNSPVLTADQNAAAIAPNTIIDAYPGVPVLLNFTATDSDASDIVTQGSNAQSILNGSVFTTTSAQSPNAGQLTWTPTTTDVRDQPYFFNITAKDNACPYPASITNTYGIRVRNITGNLPDCFGATTFLAYPNPSNGDVNFKIVSGKPKQTILIYNAMGQEVDRISLAGNSMGKQNIRWENASRFAAGAYVARLVGEGQVFQTLKFSKLQ